MKSKANNQLDAKLVFEYCIHQAGEDAPHSLSISLTSEQVRYLAKLFAVHLIEDYGEGEDAESVIIIMELAKDKKNLESNLQMCSGEVFSVFDQNWAIHHNLKVGPILQAFADDNPVISERVAGGKWPELSALFNIWDDEDLNDDTEVALLSDILVDVPGLREAFMKFIEEWNNVRKKYGDLSASKLLII